MELAILSRESSPTLCGRSPFSWIVARPPTHPQKDATHRDIIFGRESGSSPVVWNKTGNPGPNCAYMLIVLFPFSLLTLIFPSTRQFFVLTTVQQQGWVKSIEQDSSENVMTTRQDLQLSGFARRTLYFGSYIPAWTVHETIIFNLVYFIEVWCPSTCTSLPSARRYRT